MDLRKSNKSNNRNGSSEVVKDTQRQLTSSKKKAYNKPPVKIIPFKKERFFQAKYVGS